FGMGMMVVGGILSGIGRAGMAGSGIVLDPQKQREDLKPWSRMAGGMVNDALEQVDVVKSVSASGREVIKVRCPACRTLNDEDAKFCDECGKPL
ncbi:zinc ribbon domain-containing protein, partial [bacterium]